MLKILFDASAGEIRYVFQMADTLVRDALADDPALTSVPPAMAELKLKEIVRNQIQRLALSSREQRVLGRICDEGGARPKEYKDYGFQNAPNFIQSTLQPLQEKGLLAKSTQGNAATYRPRSVARIAHGFGFIAGPQKDPRPTS